jgi:hypothetical protein
MNPLEITMHVLSLADAASVTGVQLIEDTGAQLLLAQGSELSVVARGAAKAERRPVMQLGAAPAWDIHVKADGSFGAVYAQPASAVSWIMVKDASSSPPTRLNTDAFAVYSRPHFVKGQPDGRSVTAIQDQNGRSWVTSFRGETSTGGILPKQLAGPEKSILDARLVRGPTGYWLFLLMRVPGTVASSTARKTATGTRMPGLVYCRRLDVDLNASGAAVRVLGDHPVYEFDVAAAGGDEFAIFATTPTGAILGKGAGKDGALAPTSWQETSFKNALSSPSILVHQGVVHLAALENAGEPNAHVLQQ